MHGKSCVLSKRAQGGPPRVVVNIQLDLGCHPALAHVIQSVCANQVYDPLTQVELSEHLSAARLRAEELRVDQSGANASLEAVSPELQAHLLAGLTG